MTIRTNIKALPGQGSPVFVWTNSAATIAPGATLPMSWEEYKPSSGFYLPFNYTRITNNSLVTITFYPNQDANQGIPIPAGSNVSVDADIVPALWSFAIKNEDSATTVAASQIIVLASKTPQVSK